MKSELKTGRQTRDLQLASMVIAMRVPMMMLEAMSEKGGGAETHRAVSEKVAASVDGVVSAQISLMNSAATFWFDVMRGRSPASLVSEAANKAAAAALRPGRKTLQANYKRLVPGS
ncbi:hypothetical protein GF108_15580 [Phyllobacterium sp. SYP-B3895]|uniref:hypothetical protein n=1 Tax=Phyllobacterium sp. SYP-B3895 TaxID=2663240 RepID=UPI001299789C|nr:hypothetical protein [Phyllobacterium sp. SYP-B3895]MRG56997.1 hypothetical protein [Phyllobacterium sp. SYP-B3895]